MTGQTQIEPFSQVVRRADGLFRGSPNLHPVWVNLRNDTNPQETVRVVVLAQQLLNPLDPIGQATGPNLVTVHLTHPRRDRRAGGSGPYVFGRVEYRVVEETRCPGEDGLGSNQLGSQLDG